MKTTVHHIAYGTINYEENVWSGKKSLAIGGVRLPMKKKNVFKLNTQKGSFDCKVKGNALTGASLLIGEDVIQLTSAPKWYETACSVLIFMTIMIWGNSVALCTALFPVIGGALGGAISGFTSFLCLFLMRSTKKVWQKLLIWLGLYLATLLLCYLPTALILSLL